MGQTERVMMRKPSKTTLKRKLDKAVSEIVRSQGFCSKCRMSDYSKLQAAHIFSRNMMSVRFDLKNILCLCAKCHFEAHAQPVLFAEWVRSYLGDFEYEQLKIRARSIKKWSIDELSALLKTLTKD